MLQSAVLSSASILLAILTALYDLFYPAIKEAIDLTVHKVYHYLIYFKLVGEPF